MATENASNSSINGVDYSSACEALHTFERLFEGGGRELRQVKALAHIVRAMFRVEQPAGAEEVEGRADAQTQTGAETPFNDEELSRNEQCALARDYEDVEELGTGVEARAWHVRCKLDDQKYAIKLIPLPVANTSPAAAAAATSAIASTSSGTEEETKKWEKHRDEARIMAKLAHPNVVRYYSAFTTTYDSTKWLCIRMQLYERSLESWFDSEMDRVGDLMSISSTHIKCLALSNRRMRIIVDVLHGLQFIHKNGLVHCDLHFGNVFLEQKADGLHAVIGDFGRSGAYENSGNLQSSSIHDVGTPAAERVPISGTITKSRVKKSKSRRQTMRQNKFQKYNAGLDMQRFGEIYLQIRYLQDFDFDCPEDRELALHAEYLLDSDAEIIKALARDWENIEWRCEDILKRKGFHVFSNQFSTNHKDAQRVAPDLVHWETSLVPLVDVEQTDIAKRPIRGLFCLDVCSAVATEKSLYLLCSRQSPTDSIFPKDWIFSIHHLDLTARDLEESEIYQEDLNVSLDGLLLCQKQLVSLRNMTELLIVETSSLESVPTPIKKTIVPIRYFENLFRRLNLSEELKRKPARYEVDQPLPESQQPMQLLANGPDSIIFIAFFPSHIYELDLSQLDSSEIPDAVGTPTQADFSQFRAEAAETAELRERNPKFFDGMHMFESPIPMRSVSRVQNIRAMCYVSSARELLVACGSNDRELSTIKAFSYSHKKGLELKRTAAGSMWSGVYNLQPFQCGHLVLNARTHSDGCFENPLCKQHYTELIASNPMCGSTGCVQLGVCACLEPSNLIVSPGAVKCWIRSNKDSAPAIRADNTTTDNERDLNVD